MAEVAPDVRQRQAGIGAAGARIADFNYGVDQGSQRRTSLFGWDGAYPGEFRRKIPTVVNQVQNRRLDSVPGDAAFHPRQELPHCRLLELPEPAELKPLPHPLLDLLDGFLAAVDARRLDENVLAGDGDLPSLLVEVRYQQKDGAKLQ
jgi:hypothetical protein